MQMPVAAFAALLGRARQRARTIPATARALDLRRRLAMALASVRSGGATVKVKVIAVAGRAAVLTKLAAALVKRGSRRRAGKAKPPSAATHWTGPAAAERQSGKRLLLGETAGLATRLCLVALFIAAGAAALFLNTDAGDEVVEQLHRAAATGGIFGDDIPSPDAAGGKGGAARPQAASSVAPILLSPPEPDTAQTFVRLAMTDPKRLCKAVDPTKGLMQWHESPALKGQWECDATGNLDGTRVVEKDVEDGADVPDQNAVYVPKLPTEPQLFVIARGAEKDTIGSLRIKLIADGESKAKRGATRLSMLTGKLFDVLQWQPPDGMLTDLAQLYPFDRTQLGTRLKFSREDSPGWQYNLIIIFPDSRKYRQESAFREAEQAPPAVPVPAPNLDTDPQAGAPAEGTPLPPQTQP
ncbi:DUF6030 family protein [Jiella sp. MQZ9-1]|uniref:Uncharacterized protein n=1 Tax=Jiella flava TaxID=2816857 RepID=A0A939FZX9_9HYPH|nr:DUF6030 family protein [Jiella flava]MBO0663295.1 hypothetical protein [Jiella flava]MCD2471871.1 DUF6030 family protein [Jiella flava]